jgi:hypothetical protein
VRKGRVCPLERSDEIRHGDGRIAYLPLRHGKLLQELLEPTKQLCPKRECDNLYIYIYIYYTFKYLES